MKKLLLILTILIYSCGGVLKNDDIFSGDWELSKDSPNYAGVISGERAKFNIKIFRDGIFYKVDFIANGKSLYGEILNDPKEQDATSKIIRESLMKYQLSPDKRFLINIAEVSNIIMYNEDSKTITTPFGWFTKK